MVILLVSLFRLLFGYAPITGCSLGVGGGGGGESKEGVLCKGPYESARFPPSRWRHRAIQVKKFPPKRAIIFSNYSSSPNGLLTQKP